MQTARKQISYFESLENTVRIAFAVYIVVFIGGMILTLLGAGNVFLFLQTHSSLFTVFATLFIIGVFFGLTYVIGKINWLGDLHINLDRKFFGFLEKSNDIIFRTLISTLEPDEQNRFYNLSQEKKGKITQSIFSHISGDNKVFDSLMQSGIFRNWIWYWVSIYGTFTFTVLTLSSFVIALTQNSFFSKPFFTFNWTLALSHLFVSIVIGKFLVDKTRRTLLYIIEKHQFDIANVLITRIPKQQEETEDELLEEMDTEG